MTLRYWVFSIFFCLLGCTGKLTGKLWKLNKTNSNLFFVFWGYYPSFFFIKKWSKSKTPLKWYYSLKGILHTKVITITIRVFNFFSFLVQADICLSKDGSRSREYNTETHLCCGGVVQERFNSKREERGCCGGKRERERERERANEMKYIWYFKVFFLFFFYIHADLHLFNRLEEICCKPDIVRDRYIQSGENRGKEQICCGKEIFHVDADGKLIRERERERERALTVENILYILLYVKDNHLEL